MRGKFDTEYAEQLYMESLEGFYDEIGSTDELGWFCRILADTILKEDSQGFVEVLDFDSVAEADEVWKDIEKNYSVWWDEVSEDAT